MKNLTQIMEERIKKHWDMEIVRDLNISDVRSSLKKDDIVLYDGVKEYIENKIINKF